tara:strand:- start:352 stop:561 length:210 start_codon:yes stop_codon:yes gene_type:complete
VWVAMLARGLKGEFAGAWPLALGVAFGDFAWTIAALLTLNQLASFHADLCWRSYFHKLKKPESMLICWL